MTTSFPALKPGAGVVKVSAMLQLLTLVNTNGLSAALEGAATTFLREAGAQLHDVRRFGNALDLTFEGDLSIAQVQQQPWEADAALQPAASRAKRLLVSDMEATLVRNEFLDDLATLAGVGEAVAAITARAMNGEIDFAGSLRARLELLKGQPASLLEEAWKGMVWMPGAQELFAQARANGLRTVIVSGGFTLFAGRVQELLGADRHVANDLEIEEGHLTGCPREPIYGRETKVEVLKASAQEWGIPLEATLAVGDGANDLPMLQCAGLGVAYHAKPAVAAAAACRVRFSDLRALLAFAGIA